MKATTAFFLVFLAFFTPACATRTASDDHARVPAGFVSLLNGHNLDGWRGLVEQPARLTMTPEVLAAKQAAADADMRAHWRVEDGVLLYDGKGQSLATARDYGDFELWLDWKITKGGDSGVYVRGTPQVQIWDNPIGSGGLYNNEKNPKNPIAVADRPVGEWNTFKIRVVGDRVTVHLNGTLVVDNTILENYWDRKSPLYKTGPIELQNHGNPLWFRNIYIREL